MRLPSATCRLPGKGADLAWPAAHQISEGMAQPMGMSRPQQNFATTSASAYNRSPNPYKSQEVFKPPRPEGMAQSVGLLHPQQNFATTSASAYHRSPNPYESQEVFKPPRPEGMAQSVGLLRPQQITAAASTSYQSPNSYGNQDVFKTPRRASNQNSGTPYKSPMVEEVKVICMVLVI